MEIHISEEDAIAIHFANINSTPEYTFFSGFMGALRDARKFTRRDQDTGSKLAADSFGDHGSWLGAIGYLALLDQIGSCFKPKGVQTIAGVPIVKSLLYFGGLTKDEANAIYALRCAFAHDFSLLNIHPKNPHMNHRFTVCQGTSTPVVTLPAIMWDGIISNLTQQNVTWVNLEALGDLVEKIYRQLLYLNFTGDLLIELEGGAKELFLRYSICSPNNRTQPSNTSTIS